MTQTLYLTRGLPASGKSTFARNLVEKSNGTIVRLERDLLRDQLYSSRQYSAPASATEEEKAAFKQYLNDRETTITAVQHAMAESAIQAGKSVIISDTNLRAKFAREWQKLAAQYAINFEVINFDYVTVDECVKRDSNRLDSVGEKVIRDMASKFLSKGKIPSLAPVENAFVVEPYDNPEGLTRVVIVDIDGTLATMKNRSPYDWQRVGEDEPAKAVIAAVHAASQFNRKIIVMSGRDASCRNITQDWLTQYLGVSWHELHMRPEGDNRKDNIIKYELFNNHIRGKYHVEYVLDDRPQVCRMWRKLGLFVFQVGDPYIEF